MPKQPINIRLDSDLIAAADERAAATGTNRTALIDSALREWLERPVASAPRNPRVVGRALHDSVPHIHGGHVVRLSLGNVGPKPAAAFTPIPKQAARPKTTKGQP